MDNSELEKAKKLAAINGLDIQKSEALLHEIEDQRQRPISEKYKIIFYLASTGLYSAEDMARIFNHKVKNINPDFNKNLGEDLRMTLELEDYRLGITSLRRILFEKGYFVPINDEELTDILPRRLAQKSAETSTDIQSNIQKLQGVS